MRILVIEDDTALTRVIRRGLEQQHHSVDSAEDGARGLEMARNSTYGLIILDLLLPTMDGWTICDRLREAGDHTPILMLTAQGTVDDRVRGLRMGADDYLPKPFAFPELMARVEALLRRDKVHKARIIRVADLEIDTGARRVTRAGVEIRLSHREYELLDALASNEGRVLTREAIQERIWMDDESYSNTVDVYIGFLRKKIDAAHDVKLIHTVRGAGYSLRRPEKA